MDYIFAGCPFNGDISQWDISKLETTRYMFSLSEFTGDISNWKPYKLIDTYQMFSQSKLEEPYWLEYEDLEMKRVAIDSHHLNKELGNELVIKDGSNKKRIKI